MEDFLRQVKQSSSADFELFQQVSGPPKKTDKSEPQPAPTADRTLNASHSGAGGSTEPGLAIVQQPSDKPSGVRLPNLSISEPGAGAPDPTRSSDRLAALLKPSADAVLPGLTVTSPEDLNGSSPSHGSVSPLIPVSLQSLVTPRDSGIKSGPSLPGVSDEKGGSGDLPTKDKRKTTSHGAPDTTEVTDHGAKPVAAPEVPVIGGSQPVVSSGELSLPVTRQRGVGVRSEGTIPSSPAPELPVATPTTPIVGRKAKVGGEVGSPQPELPPVLPAGTVGVEGDKKCTAKNRAEAKTPPPPDVLPLVHPASVTQDAGLRTGTKPGPIPSPEPTASLFLGSRPASGDGVLGGRQNANGNSPEALLALPAVPAPGGRTLVENVGATRPYSKRESGSNSDGPIQPSEGILPEVRGRAYLPDSKQHLASDPIPAPQNPGSPLPKVIGNPKAGISDGASSEVGPSCSPLIRGDNPAGNNAHVPGRATDTGSPPFRAPGPDGSPHAGNGEKIFEVVNRGLLPQVAPDVTNTCTTGRPGESNTGKPESREKPVAFPRAAASPVGILGGERGTTGDTNRIKKDADPSVPCSSLLPSANGERGKVDSVSPRSLSNLAGSLGVGMGSLSPAGTRQTQPHLPLLEKPLLKDATPAPISDTCRNSLIDISGRGGGFDLKSDKGDGSTTSLIKLPGDLHPANPREIHLPPATPRSPISLGERPLPPAIPAPAGVGFGSGMMTVFSDVASETPSLRIEGKGKHGKSTGGDFAALIAPSGSVNRLDNPNRGLLDGNGTLNRTLGGPQTASPEGAEGIPKGTNSRGGPLFVHAIPGLTGDLVANALDAKKPVAPTLANLGSRGSIDQIDKETTNAPSPGSTFGLNIKAATNERAAAVIPSILQQRIRDLSPSDSPARTGEGHAVHLQIAGNLQPDATPGQQGQVKKREADTIGGYLATQTDTSARTQRNHSEPNVQAPEPGRGPSQPSFDRPNNPNADNAVVKNVGAVGTQRSPESVQACTVNQPVRSSGLSRMAVDGDPSVALGKLDSSLVTGLIPKVDGTKANLADALVAAQANDRIVSASSARIEPGISLSGKPVDFTIGLISKQPLNSGNEVKINSVFVGTGKNVGTEVSPLSVQQFPHGQNTAFPVSISGLDGRTSTAPKIEVVIGEPIRAAGLVDSINALAGKLFPTGKSTTTSDGGAAKVDVTTGVKAVSIQIGSLQGALPGIVSGAVNATTSDLTGGVKDASGLTPVAKVDTGNVLSGIRSDFISGLKEQIATLLPTSLAGKLTTSEGPAIKADGVTVTSTSINNPQGFVGAKNDAIVPGRVDAAGTIRSDGTVKGDGAMAPTGKAPNSIEGIVRGIGLTPPLVASIASAIKFGQPLPEGVTFQNGEIAIKHGGEVLFFPGLQAALKFAELVGLVDSEPEEELEDADRDNADNQDSWASETRVKYLVKEGDTLETISTQQLGDKRFVDLVVTINRSEVLLHLVNGKKAPFVYPGQVLWLPSAREVAVHRKNYFVQKKASLLKSVPVGAGCNTDDENTSEPIEREREVTAKEACESLHAEYQHTVVNAARVGNPKTTVRDRPQLQTCDNELFSALNRVRHTGNRPSVEISVPVLDRNPRATVITAPVVLHVADIEIDTISDTILVLSDETSPAPVETQRLLEVRPLSRGARVIVSDLRSDPGSISVKLEMFVNDDWTLLAAYEGTESGAFRIRYGQNGDRSVMKVQLPSRIVKAMALEDFTRNWLTYHSNFIANVVKNGVDSSPHQQTPMPTCNKVSMRRLSSGNRFVLKDRKNVRL
ncbi:MAG: hypothetical protein K2X93_14665 [Candidatus Obscuribacterales bacterium]|nr:hypothetical protein [Candidatus Obscuribacterales bacterium]